MKRQISYPLISQPRHYYLPLIYALVSGSFSPTFRAHELQIYEKELSNALILTSFNYFSIIMPLLRVTLY